MHGQTVKRIMALAIVLIVPFIGIQLFASENAAAVGAPTVTAYLNEASQTADVSPDSNGTVTFTGYVTCTMPVETNAQKVLVSLDASAGGWPWSMNPSSFAFDRDVTTANFTCQIRVPPGASCLTSQELTISGRALNDPGALQTQVNPATAMIFIDQFFRLETDTEFPEMEFEQGGKADIWFAIRNKGNGQDTISIRVDDDCGDTFIEAGIGISLRKTDYVLERGDANNVTVSLSLGKKTPPGKYTLKLISRSVQADINEAGPVETVTTFNVTVLKHKESPGPTAAGAVLAFGLCVCLLVAILRKKARRG